MKKALILAIIVIAIIAVTSSVALAGGWSTVSTSTTGDEHDTDNPDGEAVWNPSDLGAPHGNFSTSSNRCRVCHAVHMADPISTDLGSEVVGSRIVGPTSWRLLRNQNREEECYYCHGPDGATDKQPFRDRTGVVYRGEHTLGSTFLPDSSGTVVPGGALTCGTCHNVHAAGVVETAGSYPESSMTAFMGARILKDNPNPFNNQTVGNDVGAVAGAAGADPFTKFCSDCHDRNPNWDPDATGKDSTDSANVRIDANGNSNFSSHVQGTAADGQLEVYGENVKVANYTTGEGNPYYADLWGFKEAGDANTNFKDIILKASPEWGCRGCHRASDQGNIEPGYAGSAWPHRTVGAKLLFDTYSTGTVQDQFGTSSGKVMDDATRVLPALDRLCTKCHRDNGGVDYDDTSTATQGVGVTF